MRIIESKHFVFSAAKIIPPYIKCLLLIIITCSFLQMFYRMRCITRMSCMGLWRCKLKIIGGDDFGSAAKIIHPYIKCLLFNINTCAFLQMFYRMRCDTRMCFIILWPSKLKIIGSDDFGSAAKIIHPYIKCWLLNPITCAFLQVFYRMRCITRMSILGLWRCKLEIIGGDDFGSAAKIIHPYIKCLLYNINTCAFLQMFYRMRCITRMSFMGLWSSKLEIIAGDDFSSAAKIIPPLHKMFII